MHVSIFSSNFPHSLIGCKLDILVLFFIQFLTNCLFLSQNCNSTLNSVIRRRDNKMYFARQGSVFQATFMRQGLNEDVLETGNTVSFL